MLFYTKLTMRWLLFLSRVAFLSGIMLILAFSLLIFNWNRDEPISSTIITAGYGLGLIIVPLVNLAYFILVLAGRRITQDVPRWLIIFNVFCLLVLILYILVANGFFNF